ncbi:MAG TPA: NADP-dependent phosphogluconate dehydrogenase [Candidatus Saccharimonadales bacterium]|nr:NADP-dependent phosphogluconate dehydrogenase [Candidatus Saccharimonadales bacterium]
MKIGFYGLGRMGSNMVARLIVKGQDVVVMNRSPEPVEAAVKLGAEAAYDYKELIAKLDPVIIWLMLPSEIIQSKFEELLPLVPTGAIIIDGGNSDFRYSQKRYEAAKVRGVHFIDIGTSGGILGRSAGYCLMVGGDNEPIEAVKPILDALSAPYGWRHFPGAGAGHFVKMVHNAIEYGVMESYAEGYRMLKEGPYKNIDLATAGEVWQRGSIIESKLNELTAQALRDNPNMEGVDGVVAESGEARWTLEVAKEMNIPLPAIQSAYDVRLKSQAGEGTYATKVLAAMRNKFGGHDINPVS